MLWAALRRRFPEVLITEVMPDHVHTLPLDVDPDTARVGLAKTCGELQRALGLPPGSWEPVPEARVIEKRAELRRHFRYVALNECRRGIAADPLEAVWSTYREMFGTVDDPWVDPARVLRALGFRGQDRLAALHAYVSGDPSVRPDGTPMPLLYEPSSIATCTLEQVIAAAAIATRSPMQRVRERSRTRKVFVWLAREVGWWQPALLAQTCGISPDAIRRIARESEPAAVQTALACLGDPRLLARAGALRGRDAGFRAPPARCWR